MLKKILLVFAVAAVALCIYVAAQPSEFTVSRSIKISASPEAIFPYVNGPKKMDLWNPWMKVDPNVKTTYTGPEEGVGAKSDWEGNDEIGAGSAIITESVPSQKVSVDLHFRKPFESTSLVTYLLQNEGAQTNVTWSFSGKSNFIVRLFCTLMMRNMTDIMNETFDKGLADLKAIVEKK